MKDQSVKSKLCTDSYIYVALIPVLWYWITGRARLFPELAVIKRRQLPDGGSQYLGYLLPSARLD